jgi:hypothetical protein
MDEGRKSCQRQWTAAFEDPITRTQTAVLLSYQPPVAPRAPWPITDEASPFALRSARNHPMRAVRQGAGWTSERHPAAVWSRRSPGLGSVRLQSCRGLLIAPRRCLPGGASGQHPTGRLLVAVVGMPGCLAAVHRRSASTIGCPLIPVRCPGSGVQLSGSRCPAVWGPARPVSSPSSPSSVQPVQCPVVWLPRPDAAVRPAGVRPVRRQPAGVCPPVAASRPAAAEWPRWGTPGYGGAAVTAGSSRVACGPAPSPAAEPPRG